MDPFLGRTVLVRRPTSRDSVTPGRRQMNDHHEVTEAIIEEVSHSEIRSDFEGCPCCEAVNLLRMICRQPRAVLWLVFCSDCGQFIAKRWNLLP